MYRHRLWIQHWLIYNFRIVIRCISLMKIDLRLLSVSGFKGLKIIKGQTHGWAFQRCLIFLTMWTTNLWLEGAERIYIRGDLINWSCFIINKTSFFIIRIIQSMILAWTLSCLRKSLISWFFCYIFQFNLLIIYKFWTIMLMIISL